MPVQQSKRGQAVTTSPFEAPFETNVTRFGMKGLNITDAIDAIEPDELTRMLNVMHRQDGSLTPRWGQISVANAGSNMHSIKRLSDPADGNYIYIVGSDTNLYSGVSGGLTQIDSGYSGDPLWMVPYRPPFSSETWMYVADSDRMRKVRTDGLDLQIGLPAPTVLPTIALDTEQRTVIANFVDDGTDPPSWTNNAGFTYGDEPTPTQTPEIGDIGDPDGGSGIVFNAKSDLAPQGYYEFWGVPHTVDLSKVGTKTATDDDIIHLWLNFSHTDLIEEFRIYFVCSEVFSPSIIPGISGQSGTNGEAYVKAFSANDFATFAQARLTQFDASERARIRQLRDDSLRDSTTSDNRTSLETIAAGQELDRTITFQGGAAGDTWYEFGIVGIPVRRGDFQRLGQDTARNWSNITGIITMVVAGPGSYDLAARISALYMTGGAGPDTTELGNTKYDYRYTHYDTRTGTEGNPSEIMADASFLDAIRRGINVTPTAFGDADIRQRIYRRGGTLPTDWYFLGTNTADGAVFLDELTDNTAVGSSLLEIDHDQPISTVDSSGTTVLNSPLPVLWGPLEDLLMGCGDPYRPGHVYFCKPGEPDLWPPDNVVEVCSPSEELMAGGMYGEQAFVFSRERLFTLYPNLSGDGTSITSTTTQCKRGMINRWGLAIGIGGIYFIANDGIYCTSSGPEEWISRKIDPLFRDETKNGYSPIDFDHLEALRLEIHENELYFMYQPLTGDRMIMVYSIPYKFWRPYLYDNVPSVLYSEEDTATSALVMGGADSGELYFAGGTADDGVAIPCQVRTGSLNFGRPREEKTFGDQTLDADADGVTLSVQNFLNDETVTNFAQTVTPTAGRKRSIFDAFGTIPQRARTLSTDIQWSTATATPSLYWLGTAAIIDPDITIKRVTQWDDLENADESYLMGVTFDCDTGGVDKEIVIETDYNGTTNVAAVFTVNCDGRHKIKKSWSAAQANKVRIRPDDDCIPWVLYRLDWISQPEPPRIARWDTYFENKWDQYYTGVDLFCDTSGQNKTVQVYVDSNLVKTETVNTSGRLVHHITLPWGRGHVFHLVATDTNPGILYDVRWQLEAEPSEQTNWNQNFTVEGTEADKYLKAIVFQCDTFGQNKAVTVECDGVVVETLTVNATGRKVVQLAFPQHLGRVFRIYPTDAFPGRLYSVWWVFDQEPLALDRWETQEIDHRITGWHYPIWSHVTIKSVSEVNLQVKAFNQLGAVTTKNYTIPSTSGLKIKQFVPFEATKGILYKYILTSDDPFWLYREETSVMVRVWGTDQTADTHIFGNDDIDATRVMTKASLAAARSGGGTG